MIVSLIVAMDELGGIGKDNCIPWRLSSDMKRFKALTMGHTLVMGRKTYETIGRPLPGRTTIIVTHDPEYQAQDCLVALSFEQAIETARERGETETFVAGGSQIYACALPAAQRLYLTRVHTVADADTFFPAYDPKEWEQLEAEQQPANEKNQFPSTFYLFARKT